MQYNIRARAGSLDYLSELWAAVTATRSRDWFYDYLAAVYKYYYELRRHRVARKTAQEIQIVLSGGRAKFRNHPIRVLLDATCTADRRTKSRWTMALRYAWRRRTHWNGVVRYIKGHGGVSSCARLFAQIHPIKEHTRRYRGPGARPISAKLNAQRCAAVKFDFRRLSGFPISRRLSCRVRPLARGLCLRRIRRD
jgi:hypothetical protein